MFSHVLNHYTSDLDSGDRNIYSSAPEQFVFSLQNHCTTVFSAGIWNVESGIRTYA